MARTEPTIRDARPRSPRPLPSLLAVVVAGLALLLAASGGAVAGSLITGAQIKDGSVAGRDVKDRSLTTADLAATTRQRLRGPRGPRGAPGEPGLVRGWARVSSNGVSYSHSPGVVVDRSLTGDPGTYCVTVPGVSPNGAAPVVTLDLDRDTTQPGVVNGNQAFAEVADGAGSCLSGAFLVVTWKRTYELADGGTRIASTVLTKEDQGFNVLVP